ncbi:MAG: protein-glutamate O-methyltransferase CheR [Desulfuromonadaceae bacterium]|nr:protein-glutamate O-methyltransferase CheR [Desulfuromonadaceae bacterium]
MNSALSGLDKIEHLDIGDDELAEISMILEKRRSFSMSVYKDKCMKRRVAIRMRSSRCHDAAAYCNLLRQSERELDLLLKALTIHVSQFFRNPSMFEKLQREVFPLLYQSCGERRAPLRIWSLGCAGGEEAYSLAILLREYFPGDLRQIATNICATDIDEETLHAARKAEFNDDRLKDLPVEFCERYFDQSGSRMKLKDEIREMVTFCRGDIMAVEKFFPSDLVLCRNTLIYFTRPDQEKILNGVADILPIGGILVLGKSETLVGEVRGRFVPVCPVERIYRRI